MIRAITHEDRGDLLEISIASGLFDASDVGQVAEMIDAYLDGNLGAAHQWITVEQNGKSVAVVYFAPEPFTSGVWNLYMLAVAPEHHGNGCGAALIRHVEDSVRAQMARILIVETSSLARFARTRSFYEMCGFVEESRIRDYYSSGDDKITFWKRISDASTP